MKNRLIELQTLVNGKRTNGYEPNVTLTIQANLWCLELVSQYLPSDETLIFVDENDEDAECEDCTTIVYDEDFDKVCDKFAERMQLFDQGYHLK